MAVGRRPKRSNPHAQRMTFVCELGNCPHCGTRLSAEGCGSHSNKTVQTLTGEWRRTYRSSVIAYSRLCPNASCRAFGEHFHAAGHLRVSPPYSTYGMDVIAWVGMLREREHKQFVEIQALLNQQGVAIKDWSVGRLYRLFLALLEGTWPQGHKHLVRAAQQHGGLILMADGLAPEGTGAQLYVLWEVFSGMPVSGMLIEQADTAHLTTWLRGCQELIGDLPVLALLSDQEKALGAALRTIWSSVPHQLCQMHFLQNLSAPMHRADQRLRQTLQDHVGPLPPVADLEGEESCRRITHRESTPDAAGGKGAHG